MTAHARKERLLRTGLLAPLHPPATTSVMVVPNHHNQPRDIADLAAPESLHKSWSHPERLRPCSLPAFSSGTPTPSLHQRENLCPFDAQGSVALELRLLPVRRCTPERHRLLRTTLPRGAGTRPAPLREPVRIHPCRTESRRHAASTMKSSGIPKVSYKWKAADPERRVSSFIYREPSSSVRANCCSSASTTLATRSAVSFSSDTPYPSRRAPRRPSRA